MNSRFATTAIAAVATAALLAACASPAAETTGEDVEPADSLTLWHGACATPAITGMYEAFEEATGITLEIVDIPCDGFEQATTTRWATGDRPDVLTYHAITSLLLPLNPVVNMQDLSDMDFVDRAQSTVAIDGVTYGALTQFPEVYGFYYNKAVLEEAGLDAPTAMPDLLDICAGLAGSGIAPIFESGASVWPTQLIPLLYMADANVDGALGQAVLAKEVDLGDPDGVMVEGLEFYQELVESDCVNENATTTSFEDSLAAVIDGRAAMTALHSNFYESLVSYNEGDREGLDDKVGFTGLSADSSTATANYGPFGTYYAPKTGDAAKELAARMFIEFATGEGYQAMVDSGPLFPIYEGATTPDGFSELQLAFQAAAENASPGVNAGVPGFVALKEVTSKILAGQTTAVDGVTELVVSVEQAARAAGVDGW